MKFLIFCLAISLVACSSDKSPPSQSDQGNSGTTTDAPDKPQSSSSNSEAFLKQTEKAYWCSDAGKLTTCFETNVKKARVKFYHFDLDKNKSAYKSLVLPVLDVPNEAPQNTLYFAGREIKYTYSKDGNSEVIRIDYQGSKYPKVYTKINNLDRQAEIKLDIKQYNEKNYFNSQQVNSQPELLDTLKLDYESSVSTAPESKNCSQVNVQIDLQVKLISNRYSDLKVNFFKRKGLAFINALTNDRDLLAPVTSANINTTKKIKLTLNSTCDIEQFLDEHSAGNSYNEQLNNFTLNHMVESVEGF